ncbi:MAG: 1,4-dihydroxy-2-naphthoate octaprenyltransferase [Maribacter sp.]
MTEFSAWINAARLRTLPLSVSGVMVGTALANFYGKSNISIFILALLTAIGFQITSNFANDYGDGVKGTDNDERIGPKRALQSGLLSKDGLKRGIIISIIINFLLIISLVYIAFGLENIEYLLFFMLLGGLSIWAAIKYTIGESAYGYRGLGDIFVFLFFGLVAVLGAMFLYTKSLNPMAFLPAISVGLLSVGVLNLNNLRDHQSDRKVNKNTLIVQMGYSKGILYHTALLLIGLICFVVFIVLNFQCWLQCIPLLAFAPILLHLRRVYKIKDPSDLDPELKKLAISIFLIALLFYISNNIFCNFDV